MGEATHIFDPQGEVIIILQSPDYVFAPWNECETDHEPIKPHADERKIDMSNDVAPSESHEVVGRRKATTKKKAKKNKKKSFVRSDSGKPTLPNAEPPAEGPPAEEPPNAEPPVEESPNAEPPAEGPPAEEPPNAEPPVEESPNAEPPAEGPPAEEPPNAEPPVEESPNAEPPAEEPPAEEPAPFDEQLEEAYPKSTLGSQFLNVCDEHDEITIRTSGNEENVIKDCFRIQVSAKHLTLSSPVFNKTLTGGWKEGFHLLRKGSVEITTSGWDLEAFLILMGIFHCQPQNLPQRISLELLAKVAVLADYYECQTVVRFFADKWIDALKESFPTVHSRDLMLWIWVSWAFRLCPQFENSTSIAISESNDLITNLGLPIPETVIDEMNNRRHDAISVIFSTLIKQRDAFLSGSRGCSFECRSIMFGALTKHMHSTCLLSPQPKAPFIGLNYNDLMETVSAFKSPQWSSSFSSYSSSYRHHCGDSSFSSLIIIPEDAVKGLSMATF